MKKKYILPGIASFVGGGVLSGLWWSGDLISVLWLVLGIALMAPIVVYGVFTWFGMWYHMIRRALKKK